MESWEDLQQSILNGSDEDDLEPEPSGEAAPGPTYEQAATHAKRLRYHQEQIWSMERDRDLLLLALQRQMDEVNAAHGVRVTSHILSREYHETRLIAYAQAHPPHRGKTVAVPGATIAARSPAPKLVIDDRDRLLQYLIQQKYHKCLRIPSPEVSIADLKAAITEGNNELVLLDDQILPGVRMVRAGDVYTVHLSKGGE